MQTEVKAIMEDCVKGSLDGAMTFPDVVAKLMGAGVERYHADLCRAEKTYYMPDGTSHVVANAATHATPAREFSVSGLDAALRAIQAKTIDYRTFCDRIAAAGCVEYIVSLVGRRAVYFGRTGEPFVEPFPAAKWRS